MRIPFEMILQVSSIEIDAVLALGAHISDLSDVIAKYPGWSLGLFVFVSLRFLFDVVGPDFV